MPPLFSSTLSQTERKKRTAGTKPTPEDVLPLLESALHFTTLTEAHDMIVLRKGNDPFLMDTHVCSQSSPSAKKTAQAYAFPEWTRGEFHARHIKDIDLRRFAIDAMEALYELVDELARRGSGRGLFGIGHGRTFGRFTHRVKERRLAVTAYTNRTPPGPYEFVFLVHDAP